MKKVLLLTLFVLAVKVSNAQDSVSEVSLDFKKMVIKPVSIKPKKNLKLSFKGCELISGKVRIVTTIANTPGPAIDPEDCSKGFSLPWKTLIGNKDSLNVTLVADNIDPKGKGLTISLLIDKAGRLTGSKATNPAVAKPETTPLSFEHDFIKPEYLAPSYQRPTNKDCLLPMVIYDPCCNQVLVYENNSTKPVNFL
jgi:hypothetical protein